MLTGATNEISGGEGNMACCNYGMNMNQSFRVFALDICGLWTVSFHHCHCSFSSGGLIRGLPVATGRR